MTKANRVVQYRFVIFLVIAIIFNVIVIAVSIKSGIGRRDIMLRFNERHAVTFLSALMLGLTSLTSFIIYIIHVKAGFKKSDYLFWLVSAAGFLYLCLDEYFMMHE